MRASRITAVLAAVPLLVGTTGGLAMADEVSNRLDTSVDAVAEVMPLNLGGPDGTTQLYIVPANGDGKNGCNLTGGTSLSVRVASSNTAVATVNTEPLTFTSCGDTKTVTVKPVGQGSSTISLSQLSNSTGASFNLDMAKFTVNVAPPANSAPKVTVHGVTGGATYDQGSVPEATCQVTDTEDGSSSFPATLSAVRGPYAEDGIGEQTAGCSYTDSGGLTASASETYQIVDPSGPVVGYDLDPAAPDGDNDWYTSDVELTWHVSDPQAPSSVAKTGCVDQVITTDQAATAYSCSATSAGGSAAEQTVTIKRDGTAPKVTFDGVTAGTEGTNGWYTSDVTVTFTATDAMSGPATASRTVTSSGQGDDVVVPSPAFSDEAGNTTAAGAVEQSFKIDKAAPNAPTASVSPAPNAAGWSNGDVVVSFTPAGDNGPSGVAACTADVTVDTESAGHTVSGTCTDAAGNVSAENQVLVKLDKTGPTVVEAVDVAGTTGDNGWYTSDVEVTFTATDGLSGPATATKKVSSSGQGDDIVVGSPAFSDGAGNTTAAGAVQKSFKIDKSAPSAPTFNGGPGNSYYYGSDPAAPTCSSSDAVSGLASCVVTGGGTSVGTHTYTATATDNAGNTSTRTLTYQVLPWTTKGFYSPVDLNGVWNTVKGGSTVPLKFEVFAGAELTSTSAVKGFGVRTVGCPGSTAAVDEIELVTTGGTSLRYDTTGGQFVQNWQTPKKPGACYAVTMTTQDGSAVSASFLLK